MSVLLYILNFLIQQFENLTIFYPNECRIRQVPLSQVVLLDIYGNVLYLECSSLLSKLTEAGLANEV